MNYNTNQVYSGKASLPNPPTYSLGKSSSQQRLASNAAIQKYPDLRRVNVGGGAILGNSGLSPAKGHSPRNNLSGDGLNYNGSSGSLTKPLYTQG